MTESVHGHYKNQGNKHRKRWVFRRLQKTGRDCADISWHGKAKAFQIRAAVIEKARLPTVNSHVRQWWRRHWS